MTKTVTITSTAAQLAADKKLLDADIARYAEYLRQNTLQEYGPESQRVVDAFLSILERGGKRLRGALVIEGYRMCGGQNQAMIIQAARAIEMLHAYLLIVDDIQDQSASRRGGEAAHVMLTKPSGDQHLGESLATNAALLGSHAAMMILANLDAPAELRSNVLSILNRTLLVTFHGQTHDLINPTKTTVKLADVENVMTWKTATYSILNPLHVGMVLAGADCHATDGITDYAMAIGRAFQITDDIIGVFGNNKQTGKDNMDDIREGKQTLLTVYTLQHTDLDDANFLKKNLGNRSLTVQDFRLCQNIIRQSGALDYAQKEAKKFAHQALSSLPETATYWSAAGNDFLRGLAEHLLTRNS